MDPGVYRIANWWGTFVVGLVLIFIGVAGYLWVVEDLNWYRTDVSDAEDVQSMHLGDYARVEGTVAQNTSEDVFITEFDVEKAIMTVQDYEYHVDWIWVEDDKGGVVLILFDHVRVTKPGRHGGDYHRGDRVCIGGTVATEGGVEINRIRVDFVAKYREDTAARYVDGFYAASFCGMMVILVFVLVRIFLNPRKEVTLDWRGT